MLMHGITLTPQQLKAMDDRPTYQVEYAVIHHTAERDQNESIEEIAAEEIANPAQGFITVGYHFVIKADGEVMIGRPLNKKPAANEGLNTQSVAICLEGNFEVGDAGYTGEIPSEAAIKACITLINNILKPQLPNMKRLIGHQDVARIVQDPTDATACPGSLLESRLHDIRVATQLLAQ